VYQDDALNVSTRFAERMTYRNTSEELGQVIPGVPSAHTINRHVIQVGQELNDAIHQRELVATTHQADGTMLHSRNRSNHDLNIVVATAPDSPPRLRSLTVGLPWAEHRPAMERTRFETRNGVPVPPTTVSDMEKGLAGIITPENGRWQPCLVHVVRYTGFSLWNDGMAGGDEKARIVTTVQRILAHLRNSLALHIRRGETAAVEHRIVQTKKEFRRLATILENSGRWRTARFLNRMSNEVTTFASLALQGITVPWHNNLLERLMGEVSKRCKHKWMSWTTSGSQALLTLIVTRALEPDTHDQFFSRKLYGERSSLTDMGIRVTCTAGAEC
jgi:hypothetical protein